MRITPTLVAFVSIGLCTASAQAPDLSRLVVVGDSLSAGYQNGSLLAEQQWNGYANLVAIHLGASLPLPLIGAPGIPNVLVLREPCLPVVGTAPGVSAGRLDPSLQAMNLAVPGHTVQDALTFKPDLAFDDLGDLILGLPGLFGGVSASQVEWAEMLAPTTVFVWIGNNDTLGAALEADASLVTPQLAFEAAYTELLDRLAATGATLVVANLPDVTVIPYLTSAEDVALSIGLPLAAIGPALGLAAGDYVTPDAPVLIGEILAGLTPGPLPGDVVLDAGEVVVIRHATRAFNDFIATKVAQKNAVLIDIHQLLGDLDQNGLDIHGMHLSTDYLGGLFSLDGFHPTNTGYAILGNAFIQGMNASLGSGYSLLRVGDVAIQDPLVDVCTH